MAHMEYLLAESLAYLDSHTSHWYLPVGARHFEWLDNCPRPFQCANTLLEPQNGQKKHQKHLLRAHESATRAIQMDDLAIRTERMAVSRFFSPLVFLGLLFSHFTTTVTASPRSPTAKEEISVIVGLDDTYSSAVDLEQYGSIDTILYKARAYAMTIPDEETLEALRNHPGVEYVDNDGMTMPMGAEEVGWGVPYIQALSDLIPPAAPTDQQVSGCFRMCIVDGGLLASHPDIVRVVLGLHEIRSLSAMHTAV